MTKLLNDRLEDLLEKTSTRRVMSSRFSHIDPDVVIDLLKTGLRLPQIAGLYGCSPNTLHYQARIKYPDFDARKLVRWGKYEITAEQVAKLYEQTKSCTKIARLLGINTHAVTERLDSLGIKRRPLYREDITPEIVVNLYKEHKRISKVATLLETSPAVIRGRLKEAGVVPNPNLRNELRRTDISTKEVLHSYDSGESMSSISRTYEASLSTIRAILVRNDRVIRTSYYQREDVTVEDVVIAYDALKRVGKVARKLKVDVRVVRERLKKAGRKTDNSFRSERKRIDIPAREVFKLSREGWSVRKIARKHHSSPATIERVLQGRWGFY